MTDSAVHPVDERLPTPRLAALGLQHVLVMYAGAIAVPLIVGRALKLSPEQVAMLISADLFCCGLVTLVQSLGMTRWFGIKLPVMMGVTFAAVGPMVAYANAMPGVEGARAIFGAIIGAGIVSILIAPLVSRMLRFFPPVVTGTIIAVIGISLMRVGINWIFGNPFGPTAPNVVDPAHLKWLADVTSPGSATPPLPKGLSIVPSVPNPKYADLSGVGIAALSGIVPVGLNPTRRGAALQRDIDHADCQLVLADRSAPHDTAQDGISAVDVESADFASELAAHHDAPVDFPEADPDDLFMLIFTSGTSLRTRSATGSVMAKREPPKWVPM